MVGLTEILNYNKNSSIISFKKLKNSLINSDKNEKKSIQEKFMNFDLITKKNQEEIRFKDTIILSYFRNNLYGINQNLNQLIKCGILGLSIFAPVTSSIFAGTLLLYTTYLYSIEKTIFKEYRKSFSLIKNIYKKNDFFYKFYIFFLTFAILISPIKNKIRFGRKIFASKDLVIKNK